MAIMVEREQQPNFEVKSGEEIELPEHLKDGITAVETAARANVKDGGSQIPAQTSGGTVVNPPADTKTLISWAKGPIESALTWLGAFWLRMIKKVGRNAA